VVSIAGNEALYNLIGTTYGGDGNTTFALPDLRGRVPVHQGNNYVLGQQQGAENVTLTVDQLPHHNHSLVAATAAEVQVPTPNTIPAIAFSSGQPGANVYGAAPPNTSLIGSSIGPDGQSLPHANIQPYLAVNYIIAMGGTFPHQ
jgi:microcystin-dependent protein